MTVRKVMGHLVGTGVFIAGFYLWFMAREKLPPQQALTAALKRGVAYFITYSALQYLLMDN